MKKQLPLGQLSKFKYLSNLQANPSKNKAAFTLATTNLEKNQYERSIWLFQNEKVKPLTTSGKDLSFLWDDDSTILFASKRDNEQEATEETPYYRISTDGGEAQKAFTLKVNVKQIEKIKDHMYLVVALTHTNEPKLYEKSDKKRKKILDKRKEESYFDIIEEIPWWFNGAQITDNLRNRLFIFDEKKDSLQPITPKYFNVDQFTITEDKQRVLVTGIDFRDVSPLHNHLVEVSLDTLKMTPLIESDAWSMGSIEELEGEIVVVSSDTTRQVLNQNRQFRQLNRETKTLETIDNRELLLGNSIGSDVRLGGSKILLKEDNTLLYNATISDHSELIQFDLNESRQILNFDGSIDGFCLIDEQLLVIGQHEMDLQEVYLIKQGKPEKISDFNTDAIKNYFVSKPEVFEFESHGDTLKGYVLLPENFETDKTYPAILDIHGGPKTAYGTIYYHEMQVWVNKGYVVFYTNPHGSDGVDDQFSDIFGKYGTIDYDDIMKLTDEVLERYPNIDTKRLGVTGGSYGGFMTNWIIGHTNRFKTAVTQRSISNWISFGGVSDIGYYFAPDQIRGDIYSLEGQQKLWDHSPLKYVNQMETPTLIIHSKYDYRCPIDQGYQLFTALKQKGVASKMVILNEENHDLSRSGKPKARLVRLQEMTKWFDKYLT